MGLEEVFDKIKVNAFPIVLGTLTLTTAAVSQYNFEDATFDAEKFLELSIALGIFTVPLLAKLTILNNNTYNRLSRILPQHNYDSLFKEKMTPPVED